MKTRITELFGIEHPIIQGGMHYVGFAELAAAVSNAGGLGLITGLTQRTPELLAQEIARCREMTDKPFGVNLTFLPTVSSPDYPGYIRAILDGGIKAVETAGNNPQKWLPALHEAGVKVIHKCTSVRHALKAESIGCDAVSVDGFECGGHPGEDDVPNFILLPRAADELKIPFVASGGMADGRSLVAALALGAEGMNMGTRFIATQEAPVHENVKQAIVAASELDTRLVMRPLRNTERVLKNAAVERLIEKERALGAALKFEDILDEVAGVYPKIMKEGTMDAGAWSCGMVAGLIHDVPTVKQLIDRIMREAEEIIGQRLARFAARTAARRRASSATTSRPAPWRSSGGWAWPRPCARRACRPTMPTTCRTAPASPAKNSRASTFPRAPRATATRAGPTAGGPPPSRRTASTRSTWSPCSSRMPRRRRALPC
jgi:NAD(P)H-dependent flavin oxidoreductase YrpB (nitropropane dioxygenase family)